MLRIFLIVGLCLIPLVGAAGPVKLTSSDGQVVLEGQLLSQDGEFFRVETVAGPVTLDAGRLRCSGAGCPDPAKLVARARVGGAPDMIHRLIPALLEVFADLNGLEYIRRFTDDTTVAWELREADTDRMVAIIDGTVAGSEVVEQQLASRDIDLGATKVPANGPVRQDVIALDALVPSVATENPRAMLTFAQLEGLLSGRLSNWSRLGGEDLSVELHLPKGWDDAVQRLNPDRRLAKATFHESPADLSDAVAANPAAIGLVPYSAIGNTVPLVISGACGLAAPATRDTIRAKDYPITKALYLQRVGARQPKIVRDFIAFARSAEAQPIIRAAGYVDQAIGRIGFERQGDRIANAVLAAGNDTEAMAAVQNMIATLLEGERLTLTFRFQDGSSDLVSAPDVQRLADAIDGGEFDGHEVLFVGFSDGIGPEAGNVRLSERRARAVRRAVAARVQRTDIPLRATGFGEVMPMACDDTPWGRQVNRRVEVWLRKL
ncbi:MAG: OmpA family protein [Paracoccaceae bacterium]|nr:OmpA family protein [Paracoccaceae bacterium]